MQTLLQDLRYGARMLLKSPTYTIVAVIALALGIGANTAIFSVVNAVLLRPLPYIDAERLAIIEAGDRQAGGETFGGASPADFWDWQDRSTAFEQVAVQSGGGFSLTGVENPVSLPGARVSTNYFETVGAKPYLGRTFQPEDGSLKAPFTIILSYRLWQERFGGDPDIIGKRLGDTDATVIGVMPPDFKYPAFAEVWTPLTRESSEMRNRTSRYFSVFGLLRRGQTIESAQAELQTIAANLEMQYPDTNKNITVRTTMFREWVVRDVKTSLWILLGAVGLVLLIACANVANLLLARAASRRKEMAIRLALGASRWRVMRQLLTESLLIAFTGGVAGLLLALWSVEGLVRLLPESWNSLKTQDTVPIDATVLGFTLAVAWLTGFIFGLVPAWQASRPDVNEWLKEGGRGSEGAPSRRTRDAFVIAEIALALVLLIGAGLLTNSFVRLQRNRLGFDPHNLMSVTVGMPFNRYANDEARTRFIKRLLDETQVIPGIESVAATSGTVFPFLNFTFNIESNPLPTNVNVLYDAISPNYFRALNAQLLAGREFTERDDTHSPAVAIINEAMARQYFAGDDPLGQRIAINFLGQRQKREIVGVVKDINQGEAGKVRPQVYVSYQQQPWFGVALLVHATGDLTAVKTAVQNAIWSIDKAQPVSRTELAENRLSAALGEPRLYAMLLGGFALVALLLAAVGIYGVMAYSVTQRTHEIGIRMALGARPRDVRRMVVRHGMTLTLAGVGLGLAASFALTRLIKGLLYGVSATDPLTFTAVAALLAVIALLACYIPARQATKVDPMIALRYE